MAANTLPPLPTQSPIVDKTGFLNRAWWLFFQELFKRVGGNSAPSNTDLDSLFSDHGQSITQIESNITLLNAQVGGLSQGPDL